MHAFTLIDRSHLVLSTLTLSILSKPSISFFFNAFMQIEVFIM